MRDMCDLSDTRVSDTSDTAATSVGAIERALVLLEGYVAVYGKASTWEVDALKAARDELATLRARPDVIEQREEIADFFYRFTPYRNHNLQVADEMIAAIVAARKAQP